MLRLILTIIFVLVTSSPIMANDKIIDIQEVKLENGLDHSTTILHLPERLMKDQKSNELNFNLRLPKYDMEPYDANIISQIKLRISQGSKEKLANRPKNPEDIQTIWIKDTHPSDIIGMDIYQFSFLKFDWNNIPDLTQVVYVPKDQKIANRLSILCAISGKIRLEDERVTCSADYILENALSVKFDFPKTQLPNWMDLIQNINEVLNKLENK